MPRFPKNDPAFSRYWTHGETSLWLCTKCQVDIPPEYEWLEDSRRLVEVDLACDQCDYAIEDDDEEEEAA